MEQNLEDFKNGMDDFCLDLYRQISKTSNGENIFISPLSISSALLLVNLGAKGETRKEVDNVLKLHEKFAGDQNNLLSVYGEVLRVFQPSKGKDGEDNYELSLANKAFIEKSFGVKDEYLNAIKTGLNSDVGLTTFIENPGKSVHEINTWVEKETKEKIKDLVSEDIIDCSTRLVLVNAVYFKANWFEQFEQNDTKHEEFLNLNGNSKQVPLMYRHFKKASYVDSSRLESKNIPEFQLMELPYKERELSMIIILPKQRNGLEEVEKALTSGLLHEAHQHRRGCEADVWLPKFKLEEQYELVEPLKELGITKLFGNADLTGIADAALVVSAVVHKTFVDVNEEGTEAAAATAAVVMKRSMPIPLEKVTFRADHPFLFAIRHEKTGLIVFMGRVGNL